MSNAEFAPHMGPEPASESATSTQTATTRSVQIERLFNVARHILKKVPGAHTPIAIFSKDALTAQVALWKDSMNGVAPHIAVKTCNAPAILSHYYALGASFDAATAGEIKILESIGVTPDRVICTHPIREEPDLKAILRYKPRALVVDSVDELWKLARAGIPQADYSPELFIRIELPFGGLSGKFGVPVLKLRKEEQEGSKYEIDSRDVEKILKAAKQIEDQTGAKFAAFGFSSHVGTNTYETKKYEVMLNVFTLLRERLDRKEKGKITKFNLGGGYCDPEEAIKNGTTQEAFIQALGEKVSSCMAKNPGVDFIAEPGRFMVANSGAIVIGVTRTDVREFLSQPDGTIIRTPHLNVYMNDGLYGNLLGERHDDRDWEFHPFRLDPHPQLNANSLLPAILKGKTCDSWDQIQRRRALPRDVKAGDLLLVPNAGAYTVVTSTEFNEVPRAAICLYEESPDGMQCKLYNSHGLEIVQSEKNGPISVVPEFAISSSDGSGTSMYDSYSIMPTLSQVASSSIGLDSAVMHPRLVVGTPGWERVMHIVALHDVDLKVDNISPIAEGGMGWVLKARDSRLDRIVALKVGKIPADGKLGERFREEAAKTAKLKDDPRIPVIHSSGILEHGNYPYYTMEFIDGQTLERLLPGLHALQDKKANWRSGERHAVLNHILNVAQAIEYAHTKGVIHRDIKPSNLMVPKDTSLPIKVLDWGLFKAGLQEDVLSEGPDTHSVALTRVGAVMGTVDYMSPEQAQGVEVTKATDIWALGATLYEVVCNRKPLHHIESEQLRLAALQNDNFEIIKPSKIAKNVPAELEAIILKALHRDPSKRYVSAAEMAQDLEKFLQGKPVQARIESLSKPAAFGYSLRRTLSRKRRELALVGALGLTTLGGFLGYDKHKEHEQQEIAAKAEREGLKNTAEERLKAALEHVNEGRLGQAIDQLSPELFADLRKEPELATLTSELTQYRSDWLTLQDYQARKFKVYSSMVNSFEFDDNLTIDIDALGQAAKIYLPDGLTEQGITNLRARLDASKLTHEQRMQVGDGLIEWAVLGVSAAHAQTLMGYSLNPDSEEACLIRSKIELIESLADACEGSEPGASKGWQNATLTLYRLYASAVGDQIAFAKTRANLKFDMNSRASGFAIMALCNATFFIDDVTGLIGSLGNAQLAQDLDPDNQLATLLRSQIFNRLASSSNPTELKRHYLSALVTSLERACRLDSENPYLLGRLAISNWQLWDEEKKIPYIERNGPLPYGSAKLAGERAIKLCDDQKIRPSGQLLMAYGGATLLTHDLNIASTIFQELLDRDPENWECYILLACTKLELGEDLPKHELLPILDHYLNCSNQDANLYPEIAAIYVALSERSKSAGDILESDNYLDRALFVIESAVGRVPNLKGLFISGATRWYLPLSKDARFLTIING